MNHLSSAKPPAHKTPPWALRRGAPLLSLLLAAGVSGAFLWGVYGRYGELNEAAYTLFWSRREWLWLHLAGGAVALALGTVQVATQLLWPRQRLHRWVGRVHLAFVALGCTGAVGLIVTSPAPPEIAAAFVGTTLAWATTAIAGLRAIRAGQVGAHRRWMLRHYVVGFAPIVFRALLAVAVAWGEGPSPGGIALLLTLAWLVPLLALQAVQAVRPMKPGRP